VDNDGRQLNGSYLFDSDSRLVEVRDRLGGVNAPGRIMARLPIRSLGSCYASWTTIAALEGRGVQLENQRAAPVWSGPLWCH